MVSVNEIFYSLQGEGLYADEPMVFIRFQGCNLNPKCSFCDTKYAQDLTKGESLSIEAIIEKVNLLPPYYNSWVCITGGEPLLQEEELHILVAELRKDKHRVTIETNGSIKPPFWYNLVDSWNADMKGPSSGVCGVSKEIWFNTRFNDQIKFVVGTKEDLDFVQATLAKHKYNNPTIEISPILKLKESDDGQELILQDRGFLREVWNFTLENRLRLSIQQHKLFFGNKKGV
jgi:7-carboxy-7-deazaguanine synthase